MSKVGVDQQEMVDLLAQQARARATGILSAVRGKHFEVSQVRELMGIFPFGSEKIEAAVALAPLTVDTGNWYKVYGDLTFSTEKEELRRRVGM